MQIRFFNTLTHKLDDFKPLVPGHVGMYTCGPTVYWDQHLGNMRTFLHNDLIKRMLMANGYTVNHVMNITDVGHLTSDEDTGEDKMEKGAARENMSAWDVAKKYMTRCLEDMASLNIIKPTYVPRATDHVAEQIELIQKLEKLGFTYEIPGDGIYYDTSKFQNYGALGGQKLDELRGGARIDVEGKRNITDFALWKYSPTNAKRQMEWDSPWGVGFPGWHLECSAMSMKYLGNHFDIHTGGQDHIKVHHSNEIAQSEPIVGAPWVNYWVHYAWLVLKDGKMAKSSGSFFTVRGLIEQGYDPMAFRYMVLLGHYRQPMEFSYDTLNAAATSYKNIVRKIADLMSGDDKAPFDKDVYNNWHDKILAPVSDNLKTSEAIVVIQDLLKDKTVNAATKLALVDFIDELLGLQFADRAKKLHDLESEEAPADIKSLAEQRLIAKKSRDFATADALRGQIDAAGWTVTDTPDGFKLVKKQ